MPYLAPWSLSKVGDVVLRQSTVGEVYHDEQTLTFMVSTAIAIFLPLNFREKSQCYP